MEDRGWKIAPPTPAILDPLSSILDQAVVRGHNMKYFLHCIVTLLLTLSSIVNLHAQSQAALVDGAKKEGKLVWYTSMAIDTSKPVLDAFEKEYPFIKTELVRLGEEQLVNRILE